MTQLTERGRKIIGFLEKQGKASNRDIVSFLSASGEKTSRETVARELAHLLNQNLIRKTGKGRAVVYELAPLHPLLKPVDYESYLSQDPDVRAPKTIRFDFEVIENLDGLIGEEELSELNVKNDEWAKKAAALPPALIQKEFERITIELSWKSSKIEGNTYSLIDTEILIKEHKEAEGHRREEAVMILNHKKALDYILGNKEKFKILSLREIENVHRLLVDGLSVSFGLRSKAVGVTGSNYRPLDNQHQIREVMEKTVGKINTLADAWTKSLSALIMLSYIQPFEDGNKRASRLIANALLIAFGACPLSFRSIDEAEYKKAVILFYELWNAHLMKKLFLEQFFFAVKNYFL